MKIEQIAVLVSLCIAHPDQWADVDERAYKILPDRLEDIDIDGHLNQSAVKAFSVFTNTTVIGESALDAGLQPMVHAWLNYSFNQLPGYGAGAAASRDAVSPHAFVGVPKDLYLHIVRTQPLDGYVTFRVTLIGGK